VIYLFNLMQQSTQIFFVLIVFAHSNHEMSGRICLQLYICIIVCLCS